MNEKSTMAINRDYADLDGRLLKLLLAVVETGSITGAALQLGVTQSAVSHLLDKLRAITGDPLFVKSGRGIVATQRAVLLAVHARELLAGMERFALSGDFDPARWKTTFTIAANDFQRDVLLPPLMQHLARASAWRGAAGDFVGYTQLGDAAQRALPVGDQSTTAGWYRHCAKALVCGQVPRVLRRRCARSTQEQKRLFERRAHHRGVRTETRFGH